MTWPNIEPKYRPTELFRQFEVNINYKQLQICEDIFVILIVT